MASAEEAPPPAEPPRSPSSIYQSYTPCLRSSRTSTSSPYQILVKKQLFQIINLSSPAPTRVIRNNLGRTFAGIFGKGDRKLLFESINELVGILNSGAKSEKDIKAKHAAIHCLGAVFEAAGDSAISLANLSSTSCLKLLKLSQNHAGFRAAIFKALGRIIKGVNASADEQAVRDISKQARSAASSEKANLVQSSACWCLEQIVRHTAFYDNSNDFEKLQNIIWKAIDNSATSVRHAAASCLAAALVKAYSESPDRGALPKFKRPKKSLKKQGAADDEDEAAERPGSPAPSRSATQLGFTLTELLRQLSSHYCRSSTSNRARAGIAVCYIKILKGLDEAVVETKYDDIVRHMLNDLLSSPSITHNRYRLLITRKYVRIILEDVVGRKILGEAGQLSASKHLVNDIIKNYPQTLKERPEPTKQALTCTLSALTSLFNTLGSATSSIAETCREGLLQVLQHPSYTVQVHASACLRAFVLACPQQLLPTVTICMNSVGRELGQLVGGRQSPRKCVGFANGLSAVLSTSTVQPLYGSVDVYSRVLSQATTLLKSSGGSDLRVSSTQIQVAWILIGGLMSLGPNFVKIHLSQLLLLWKNALPKPLNKDNMVQRNMLELSFLAHVRECALGSILAFLESNSRLLTTDVTKRLAAMLQNTSVFLNSLPSKKTTEELQQRLSPALQLHDLDLMVRRRVLQCYTKLINLSPPGSVETLLQTNLLPLAVAAFADPDNHVPSSLSTTIASSAGTIETIWEAGDNSGFGVTGLIKGFDTGPLLGEHGTSTPRHWTTKGSPEAAIDRTLLSPVCSAREHDSISLYLSQTDKSSDFSDPPATEVVNAAITLFAISLPLQAPKVQESILEQMSSFLSASSLQRDQLRKTAIMVNITMALLATLKVAAKEAPVAPGDVRSPAVERAMQELLHAVITHSDQYIRHLAAEALGRLCSISGNNFTTVEVNYCIDQIVANREPNARAGYALTLGCIHSQLGGMAAGYHLRNILSILMSLANDPHPTVHFWALDSLARVADSAGLSYSSFVTSTLGMMAQLYTVDTHNEEVSSLVSSNLEIELASPALIARCIDSVINVLGPDLQDMSKARDLIMTLISQFSAEEDELMLIESLRCQEHMSLYAPGHMVFADYVKRLQQDLDSESDQIRDMALEGLHNLMRRDADEIFRTAAPGLENQLWLLLNSSPDHEVICNIIRNWLQQTGLTSTTAWVQRCQTVLTRTIQRPGQSQQAAEAKPAGPDLQDEEVAGFAAASGTVAEDPATRTSSQELLKWQVRAFALDLLSELLATVSRDAASRDSSPAEIALQQRVADVVRIAFSASTAGVVELRIRGLRIIDQVLKLFGKTPDPDFAEASLLEQYQAQIGSALTPAFAADSSPELAAEAINVCATFIATSIVTDVDRMGRILKLLVSALENFSSNTETAAIGDLKGLSSNAQVMVKMSVYSAWAELQIASAEQKYLVDVLKPYITRLTPLWLSSLREYARLRFEPDISMTSGPASLSGSLDTVYAALNRETLLKFYQDSWLKLVDAIASLIDEDSEFVFDALDGRTDADEASMPNSKPSDINYRDEPAAFFFVLFGLAFEALVGRPSDTQASREQTLEILQALKKILRPSVSGHAIYQEVVFSETMDMLDRLVLTEGLNIQAVIVEIARNLCLGHPSARTDIGTAVAEEKLSEDIDQLFELTRIIVLVLAGLVPNLTENKSQARHPLADEATALLTTSLTALVDAAAVFPAIIKTDLHACILHIFASILSNPAAQAAVVPQSLPTLRRFVSSIATQPTSPKQSETTTQLRGALARFLSILKTAQRREIEAAVACEKNTILAATILISSAATVFDPSDPLLRRAVAELADCLENGLTSKVAAGCCRSLLLLPPGRGAAESAIAALLLPRVIGFLMQQPPEGEGEGLAESRTILSTALVSFVASLETKKISTAMALVLPTLLARAAKEGEEVYAETAARLLQLAGVEQAAFREVVGRLEAAQRGFMEEVLKSGAKAGGQRRGGGVGMLRGRRGGSRVLR
ncbi:hypothetical protein H2199_005257 [Coniosporium tulheliwenetii]|uniref:Uncharacterized protein n=1 Tax=Coniosporium tulheliwenetii TaxID=3383036 RepID=A0ACC2Z3S0_9PEZI|nr:hypothetical protein H2199_005257 [Cladosporium sp. JES 115]